MRQSRARLPSVVIETTLMVPAHKPVARVGRVFFGVADVPR